MRQDILDACIRVLKRDGIQRLTTPRIAEAAGISVGSLHQYFPNKEAVLFAIHSRTTEAAWAEVQRILNSSRPSARERIRLTAHYFFVAETNDIAELGPAAQDIENYLGDDADHHELTTRVAERFSQFAKEALPPRTSPGRIDFASQLIMTVIDGVGRSIAQRQLPAQALSQWSTTVADMLPDSLGLP